MLTAVLLTASVAIPGYAQRGGHAGGFSGSRGAVTHMGGGGGFAPSHGTVTHMGGGFGGGFRSGPVSAPRFDATPRYRWNLPSRPVARAPYGGWQRQPGYDGRGYSHNYPYSKYRQPYQPYFYARSTYYVPNLLNSYWGWDDPYGYGTSDDSYAQQGQDYNAYGQQPDPGYDPGYDQQQPQQTPDVPPPPPDRVDPGPVDSAPQSPQAATTLIFKDGHSQQVHNYAMTQSTIYLLDDVASGRRTEIPLDRIDIAATQKTNREAGIEFSVPGSGSRVAD
jgi:hypothetical protein